MKEYYLIIKHYGHPVNNWGYMVIEVNRENNFLETVVAEKKNCGQYSPDTATSEGLAALKIFIV